MQSQLTELENQLAVNSNTSQTLQNYVNSLEIQLNNSTDLSQNLENQLNTLKSQLNASTALSQTLQNRIDDLESQIDDSTLLSQSLETQVSDLETQLVTAENLSQTLQNRIDDLESQIDDSTLLSQSLETQVSDLETQLVTAENLFQTLQNQINDLEEQIANLSDVILSMTPVATFDFIKDFTMEPHTSDYYQFPSDEYRTVTLVVYVYTPVSSSTELEVNVSFWVEGSSHAPIVDNFVVNRSQNSTVVKTYDVIGSPFGFMITNPTDTIVEGRFTIYMSS
jgi:CII-binding regulator of phage lambda lysogenization HflD